AAEVAGRDESEAELREKAHWYLDAGVAVVWCLFPERREVLVLTGVGESRHREHERLPPHSQLPELAPLVDDLFAQVAAHGRCVGRTAAVSQASARTSAGPPPISATAAGRRRGARTAPPRDSRPGAPAPPAARDACDVGAATPARAPRGMCSRRASDRA